MVDKKQDHLLKLLPLELIVCSPPYCLINYNNFSCMHLAPTNRPASLVLISYNTTTQLAVFQWSSVYYSNGPITGYKLYIGDADPYQLQGASNNTAEVNIGNNLSLSVRVAVVNSAGEGPQIVRNIIIDGNVPNLYNVTQI